MNERMKKHDQSEISFSFPQGALNQGERRITPRSPRGLAMMGSAAIRERTKTNPEEGIGLHAYTGVLDYAAEAEWGIVCTRAIVQFRLSQKENRYHIPMTVSSVADVKLTTARPLYPHRACLKNVPPLQNTGRFRQFLTETTSSIKLIKLQQRP